jgi:hypothetical protein
MGPLASLHRSSLASIGYSGAVLERLDLTLRSGERRSLVLKRTRPELDWTAYQTGDTRGREAALLDEPKLAGVWQVFHSPYLAYATEDGQVGLLMEDLGAHLLPDVDEPMAEAQEDQLLAALAGLHARYWQAECLNLPWLLTPRQSFAVMSPRVADVRFVGRPAPKVLEMMREGWRVALARLPERVRAMLLQPPEVLARICVGLPRTLLHGDAKVANFALLPGGRVAAFDWAWVGAGPATLDLGWYLAVNAGRLARSREEVMQRYRQLLQSELRSRLPNALWERMRSAAVLCGAVMLLWAKALALEEGEPRAAAEWAWWVRALRGVGLDGTRQA